MTVAADIASCVNKHGYSDLPAQAIEHAEMMVASTLASAAAGYAIPSSAIVRELAREQGGTAEATVWFDRGPKLPAVSAGRVNALTSDAAASDDSDLRTIVHLGTQLTSTALALGERVGAPGRDVLAAMVLGYEVGGRMGEALMPGYRNRGFHGSLCAAFGAAVASGCMLKLNVSQMAHAIAITSVSMGGLATAADTSVAREYFAGNAAMTGMQAALAAQKGYEVEEAILETKAGFFDSFGGEDIGLLTRDWGRDWDIVTDMAIKLVPGGHPYHAIGEAAGNAARQGDVRPDEVESITISRPLVPKMKIGPLPPPSHPQDLVDAAHTPAYFAAAAVVDRAFSWAHATDAKIKDPAIHRLIDLVKAGPPVTQEVERFRHGAVVTIRTKDGRSHTSTVPVAKGAGVLGLDWADIDAKFRTLVGASALAEGRMDAILGVVRTLRTAQNVSVLTDLLR
jgi:2-methylcitrate dehydratase PrpD